MSATSIPKSKSTKFENPIEFHFEEVFSYGVSNGKYGGYVIPIKLDPDGDLIEQLKDKASEHNVEIKFYGRDHSTLYLRCDQLSQKQKDELLNAGKMIVDVKFDATDTYTKKDGTTELKFRVMRLRKVRVPERILEDAPED